MKKVLTIEGINGRFSGYVEVIFNHRSEIKEGHHDAEKTTFNYGIVRGHADTIEFPSQEFMGTSNAVLKADEMEFRVLSHLQKMADHIKKPTVQEELMSKGYK